MPRYQILRILGGTLLLFGVAVLLVVAWQLVVTDIIANRAQAEAVSELEERFEIAESQPKEAATTTPLTLGEGAKFGVITIPRFGAEYAKPILEGTSILTLQQGIGHFEDTVMPCGIGNFSLAGHRKSWGQPFRDIDQLQIGDRINIETVLGICSYEVYETKIVSPENVSVVLPVPERPTAVPTEALLTLTTCHPEYSSFERYVVYARIIS